MLTASSEFWDLSSAALTGTATMARRVRLQHADLLSMPDKPLLESNLSASRYVQQLLELDAP